MNLVVGVSPELGRLHGAREGIVSLNECTLLAEHACGTRFWFESRTRDARRCSTPTVLSLKGLSAIMEQLPRTSQGL